MRILALDVGDKTIGVAVSDELLLTAQGLGVIRRSSKDKDFERLKDFVDEYCPVEMIIGFPKNMNGTVGARGESIKELAGELSEKFPEVQIKLWDERLSTVAAEKTLIAADVSRAKRKKVIDKMAAGFILQGYLDFKNTQNS